MELFIGFILGGVFSLFVNLLANYIWEKRRPVLLRIVEWLKQGRDSVLSYNPRRDGLYVINRWSPNRLLTRDRLTTKTDVFPPAVSWFDAEEWSTEVTNQAGNYAGDVCYLVDYRIDHRESHLVDKFEMTLARCDYSEHFATLSLLKKHPEIRDRITHCIQIDPIEYVRQACPSIIAINVVVLSSKGNFLAVERSRAVDTFKGEWTVGPFETMNLSRHLEPGNREEDLFALAERCLREELGLEPRHYGEIVISWIGIYLPFVRGHIVAQVKLSITEQEAEDLISAAHSVQETESIEWLPFKEEDIAKYVSNREGVLADRKWIDQTSLALEEAWRMRSVLNVV